MFALRVFQIEKFDIMIADWVQKIFQGNVFEKITLESMSPFAFAQEQVLRQQDFLWEQDIRSDPDNGSSELDHG